MDRREFLASTLTASAAAIGAPGSLMGAQETLSGKSREYYQLRTYEIHSAQVSLVNRYLRDALVPALNRLKIKPVGVFNESIGPESRSIRTLLPSLSAESLLNVEQKLMQDQEYVKAGADFLKAPASSPAMEWIDSKLMRAFEKMPRLTLPVATNTPRVFELRTYESPSIHDHLLKIEMMENGEADIFTKLGFWQVFYGDMLIGPRQPNVTYMVGFHSLADREAKWNAFFSSAEWKTLSTKPRYSFENIVSNVTNLLLTPTSYSQI